MANNHTWDYGPRGAASTRRLVDDSVLVGTGAGATPEEAYAPVFVEVADRVIEVVSLTTLPCGWADSPTAERSGVVGHVTGLPSRRWVQSTQRRSTLT